MGMVVVSHRGIDAVEMGRRLAQEHPSIYLGRMPSETPPTCTCFGGLWGKMRPLGLVVPGT